MRSRPPDILQHPHPALRQVCVTVAHFDSGLADLIDDMKAAATAPWKAKCIGLAANQIGVAKRVIIVEQGGQWIAMVNPEIVRSSGVQTVRDGCMSVDYGMTRHGRTRPAFVQVTYQDERGNECRRKAKGLNAAVIAHEIDHLNGKLFIDELTEAA